MWNRILEAFGKPKLELNFWDEAIISGIGLLFVVIIAAIVYIIEQKYSKKEIK